MNDLREFILGILSGGTAILGLIFVFIAGASYTADEAPEGAPIFFSIVALIFFGLTWLFYWLQ